MSNWSDTLEGLARVRRFSRSDSAMESALFYFRECFRKAHRANPFAWERDPDTRARDVAIQSVLAMRELADVATPYFWSAEMLDRLLLDDESGYTIDSSKLPPSVDFSTLVPPNRAVLMWFERPVVFQVGLTQDHDFTVRGLLVGRGIGNTHSAYDGASPESASEEVDSVTFYTILDAEAAGFTTEGPAAGLGVYFHPTIPTLVSNQTMRDYFLFIKRLHAGSQASMTQSAWACWFTYLATVHLATTVEVVHRIPQGGRDKRLVRKLAVPPEVRIVHWRKAAPPPPPVEEIPVDSTSREFHCHWEVQPFTRRLRDGRVIPVRGHLRGPRHLPKKDPTPVVNLVDR